MILGQIEQVDWHYYVGGGGVVALCYGVASIWTRVSSERSRIRREEQKEEREQKREERVERREEEHTQLLTRIAVSHEQLSERISGQTALQQQMHAENLSRMNIVCQYKQPKG